jgi:hypothetical protein
MVVSGGPAPYYWKRFENMPVPETTSAEALDRYVVGKKIAASKGPAWRDVQLPLQPPIQTCHGRSAIAVSNQTPNGRRAASLARNEKERDHDRN